MQGSKTLAELHLSAVGVITPNTSTQSKPPGSPWHKRGTGIQKGMRFQPSPQRRLLNFTAVDRQQPFDATSAILPKQVC